MSTMPRISRADILRRIEEDRERVCMGTVNRYLIFPPSTSTFARTVGNYRLCHIYMHYRQCMG